MNETHGSVPGHHRQPYRRLVLPEDLVTDQALEDASGDVFHHAAIAKAVGDLALSSTTPVNVALFGPWGSGKSTFYNLMKRRIDQQDPRVKVVRYDAWKYGGQDLKRNFIQDIARQLDLKHTKDLDQELTQTQERTRLRLGRWLRVNWMSILGALALGLLAASAWIALHAWIVSRWIDEDLKFTEVLPGYVNEFGLVLAAILTTLVLGPKAVESASLKTVRPAADRDDQFAHLFATLVERVRTHGKRRLIVFIDELDRCQPDDVVATLVDLKTFLDHPDCVFMVAADRDVIEDALQRVPQAKPIRQDQPYYSTPGAFLDKIFQHQIALPPLRAHALSSFAHRLVGESSSGLWHELRTADPDGRLFDDVVYILVPAHITSPRRVKVLLNNFATSARVAESRRIDWIARARELALLTVLETEFPSVAAALVRFPQLLTYLRANLPTADLDPSRAALVARFAYSPAAFATPPTRGTVAGDVLRSNRSDEQHRQDLDKQEEFARQELARQLFEYLAKLDVVPNLDDPRPDLSYLRVVGYDEGITDPALGEMIDLAADRQPEQVADAFSDQPNDIKVTAAKLLIYTLGNERGTGQANVLEATCRLIQTLDGDSVASLAALAPEVLKHRGTSTLRPDAIPGAVLLAAAAQANEEVTALLDLLDFTTEPDVTRLIACLPALGWIGEEAAHKINHAIAGALSADTTPLATALATAPATAALLCWHDVADAVESLYTAKAPTPPPIDLFLALARALLDRSETSPALMWDFLWHAQMSGVSEITEAITEQHEPLMSRLAKPDRLCAALHQIELGNPEDWGTWLPYLEAALDEVTPRISEYARDAALAVLKTTSTSPTDRTDVYVPLPRLINDDDRDSVLEAIHEHLNTLKWADPIDPDALRRAHINRLAVLTASTPEQADAHAAARLEAIVVSIAANLPTMTTGAPPVALFNEWRAEVQSLLSKQARTFEEMQAKNTAPTDAAKVEHLRLRVAARRTYGGTAMSPVLITGLVGQPKIETLATEWLELMPKVENAVRVHKVIPVGAAAMGRYATRLTLSQRSTLWIALESDKAAREYLTVVGRPGIDGTAIRHMAPAVTQGGSQDLRDAAANRLMLATFTELPTPAEAANGEKAGHKEASELAVRLIEMGGHDNVVLAGRLILHSGGAGHGAKGKLLKAFTRFANGSQARRFTKAQAKGLHDLGLLTPRKRGPVAWILGN